jgi:hypothetical protein
MNPTVLRNRLVIATSMWRESTTDPLPKLEPGDPASQIQEFEIKLVQLIGSKATRENASECAEKTWDLVHDRPDDDPVKIAVVEVHEALARLSAQRD